MTHTIRAALAGTVLAIGAAYGGALTLGVAHADTTEGCHWNGTTDWVYSDGSLCRGTGEDPTVDVHGMPACANGRSATLTEGRVMCVRVLSTSYTTRGHGGGSGGHHHK